MKLRADLARLGRALRLATSSRAYLAYSLKLALGCVSRQGRAAFVRNLRGLALPPQNEVPYPEWLKERIAARAAQYPLRQVPGRFSFLTTVYDTKARYVRRLAETVFAQTVQDFEWVLLDNGSRDPETIAAIAELAKDSRVVHLHVADNLGILGGIAACLQHATGRYVLPLDSDDLLTADALQVLSAVIDAHDEPPLLYSDEDKVKDDERPFEAYLKPAWDPVLFWNSCYIAHLCAIRRDLAQELGVYSDDAAKGCHDWDTFFRFLRNGHAPVHVPEVLYSWRIHPQSCSGNVFSKSYVWDSHRHVLGENLRALPCAPKFALESSPLFAGTPDWWVRRRRERPLPLTAVFVRRQAATPPPDWLAREPLVAAVAAIDGDRLQSLDDAVAALRAHDPDGRGLVLLACEGVRPRGDEWAWDAMGLCERFPDTAVVGGRLLGADGALWSGGEVVGFESVVGTPDRGRSEHDPGYFAWLKKQRTVSAVHGAFVLVRTDVLRAFAARRHPASLHLLGAWLSAFAHEQGRRVVFSPYVEATVAADQPCSELADARESEALRAAYPAFLAGERAYPRVLCLSRRLPFALAARRPDAAARVVGARGAR